MRRSYLITGRLTCVCLTILSSGVSFAQGGFSCQRQDTPVSVRSEGITELMSDIVLQCTGGTSSNAGAALPKYQIVISSSVPITSRVWTPGPSDTGVSEAVLIVDEPSFPEQIGCATSSTGEACPVVAGTPGSPNVFQGRKTQANTLAFRNVPLNPPGPGGTRTIRIANLRGNIAALRTQSPPNGPVQLSVQMFDQNGGSVPVRDAERIAGHARPGAVFSARTLADTPPALPGTAALTIPPASLPVGAPQALVGFNVKFTEGFQGAFRRRNVGTSSDAPLFMTVQPVPGLPYNTESGFLNTLFPSVMNMDTAGLADTGSRLYVQFRNVPKDVLIWVTTRDVRPGTTQYSDVSARAILTTADANGGGPLVPVKASLNGLSQIPVVNGTATAVWEVISANPAVLQDISFGVAISAQTANPGQGAVTAVGGLGPIETTPTQDTIPLFKDVAKAIPAFAVSNLLTVPSLRCLSAASYLGPDAAPGSIVAAFGTNLAASPAMATETILPSTLSGVTVELIDTTGSRKVAPLLFVSASQINFVAANDLEPGPVLVNVLNGTRLVASGYMQLQPVAPALFAANGDGAGVLAGEALLNSGSTSTSVPVAVFNAAASRWTPRALRLGSGRDLLFLTLYGTGIRGRRSLADIRATVAGVAVPVTYAGPQGYFSGLDQINIGPLPGTLAGTGLADVAVSIGDLRSNAVQVQIE
jgi:uncharacterized protein (TIGR03437 family)